MPSGAAAQGSRERHIDHSEYTDETLETNLPQVSETDRPVGSRGLIIDRKCKLYCTWCFFGTESFAVVIDRKELL
jgi:hypothetical protein